MRERLLFKKIKKGDRESFKLLFHHFYPKLVIYAQNYTHNKQKSEDLVQDVFLQIWECAPQLDLHTSLRSYLFAMTRNRCIDYLRSLRVYDAHQTLEKLPDIRIEREQAFNETQKNDHKKVMVLVDSLPEKMREIFRLKYIEDYTYAQIADSLDISLNTVKTQLKRAKSKLRDAF